MWPKTIVVILFTQFDLLRPKDWSVERKVWRYQRGNQDKQYNGQKKQDKRGNQDKQYNGQKKQDKRKNNDVQNIT
jgi:hypothetical protein